MKNESTFETLLEKYDVPTPRYTSYPTVPFWEHQSINEEIWKKEVKQRFIINEGHVTLYLHLPFCETLCTYCGCNKRITKNHQVELPYIEYLLKEWKMYLNIFDQKPIIDAIHLGGGTPTFFSSLHLNFLISEILKNSEVSQKKEFSIEVHPNFTTEEQLITLSNLGFERISVGVQDFSSIVQEMINRPQTVKQTNSIISKARQHGFKNINIDLVYGLPFQTEESIEFTISEVLKMKPERIAFYSYAHVPWKSAGQRRYKDEDVPVGTFKRSLYEIGRKLLLEAGYQEIGMDHFALVQDELFVADKNGTLNRNFMGYTTTQRKQLLLGLGVSSIGDTWNAFMQNEKDLDKYQTLISEGKLPIIQGHLLSNEDLSIRELILDLMCKHQASLTALDNETKLQILNELKEFENDNLIDINQDLVKITENGRIFIRNIAKCFDMKLANKNNYSAQFSKSI